MSEEKYERCAYACPECGRQCVLNQGHYPPIDAQKGILGFNLEKNWANSDFCYYGCKSITRGCDGY